MSEFSPNKALKKWKWKQLLFFWLQKRVSLFSAKSVFFRFCAHAFFGGNSCPPCLIRLNSPKSWTCMLFWRRSCVLTENEKWEGFCKILILGSGGGPRAPKFQNSMWYQIAWHLAFSVHVSFRAHFLLVNRFRGGRFCIPYMVLGRLRFHSSKKKQVSLQILTGQFSDLNTLHGFGIWVNHRLK